MHLARLVVLGAPGVGKTTLIENFLSNCVLPLKPCPARKVGEETLLPSCSHGVGSDSYSCAVILEDELVHVKIMDVPPIALLPNPASSDWTDVEGTALRSADAFILMFDLTSPGMFDSCARVLAFIYVLDLSEQNNREIQVN